MEYEVVTDMLFINLSPHRIVFFEYRPALEYCLGMLQLMYKNRERRKREGKEGRKRGR